MDKEAHTRLEKVDRRLYFYLTQVLTNQILQVIYKEDRLLMVQVLCGGRHHRICRPTLSTLGTDQTEGV